MKFSWNSIRISIAGAKLSHLVQKDKIWDHGSMVEHVRTVVVLLKKAFHRRDPEIIKKCLTESLFAQIEKQMMNINADPSVPDHELEQVNIIWVAKGKNSQHDRFTASLKFYNNPGNEKWQFIRNGDWWLLDDIIIKKDFSLSKLNN